MSLFRNTALSGASTAVTAAGRIALTIMLARELGPERYGTIVWLQWCGESLILLGSLGVNNALTRYGPDYRLADEARRRELESTALTACLGCLVVAALASLALLPLALGRDHRELVWPGVMWAVSGLMFSFLQAVFVGLSRFGALVIINVTFAASGMVFFFAQRSLADLELAALVFPSAYLTSSIVGLAVLFRGAARPRLSLRTRPPPGALAFGFNTWLGYLSANLIWTRGELSVLQGFSSRSTLALYGAATNLTSMIAQGVNLLQGAVSPQLTRAWLLKDQAGATRLIAAMSNLTFLTACLASTALVAWPRVVVTLVFGDAYYESYAPLVVMSLGATACGIGTVNQMVQIITEGRFQRNANLIGAAALLGLSLLAVPVYGPLGAAVVRSVCLVGMAFAGLIALGRLGFAHVSRPLLVRWTVSLIALGVLGVMAIVQAPTVLRLLGTAVVAAGLVALYVTRTERQMLADVLLRVRAAIPENGHAANGAGLKVLFLGETWLGSNARSMGEALARLPGIDMELHGPEEAFPPNPRHVLARGVRRLTTPFYIARFQRWFIALCEARRPDVIVVYKGWHLTAATVRRLRRTCCPVVNIYPDCSPRGSGARLARALGAYDLVISAKRAHPPRWNSHFGYRNACVFVPHGYDPTVHLASEPARDWSVDLAMVAQGRPAYSRFVRQLLRELAGTETSAVIAGSAWGSMKSSLPPTWRWVGEKTGPDYLKTLRSAKIVIAPLTPGDEDTARTYELAAANVFFIHRRSEYVETLYDPETEVPTFGDAAELAGLIRRYLPEDETRVRMAAAAHRRAVDAYSVDQRAREIADHLSRVVAAASPRPLRR